MRERYPDVMGRPGPIFWAGMGVVCLAITVMLLLIALVILEHLFL